MSPLARMGTPVVASDSLGLYLREISEFPSLSPPEEKQIAHKMRAGDRAAFRTLVECNLRFVVSLARKYRGSGYPMHELINEGNLGLIEAARRFDPNRDVRFITYAGWWIRQAILAAIAHFGHAVSVPPRRKYEWYRFEVRVRDLTQQLGRRPSMEEMAAQLDMDEGDIEDLMRVVPVEVSLNASVGEGGGFELHDVIGAALVQPIDRDLMARAFSDELGQLLSQLDERERVVVEGRYGLAGKDPRTLRDLAEELDLSIERVRQIEARALNRLRRSQRTQQLRGYLN